MWTGGKQTLASRLAVVKAGIVGTVVCFLTRVMIVPVVTVGMLVALDLSHVNKMLRFWISLFDAIKKSLEELLAAHAENQ